MTPSPAPAPGSIVVGVDGSKGSDLALDRAARTAALEHRPLTIVYAAHVSTAMGDGLASGIVALDVSSLFESLMAYGTSVLDTAVTRAQVLAPDIEVHPHLASKDPREELLALADDAYLVVVGSRGRGTIASLVLGSVSVAVSRHATCPVVVVRSDGQSSSGRGVLVEADATENSTAAIEFAYRTASIRNLPVTVLRVFWDGVDYPPGRNQVADDEPGLADERALLAESIAGMHEKFPDVRDQALLVRGSRTRELIAAAEGMDLVVVSKPSEGMLGAIVTVGTSSAVVEHAPCDVAVIPSGPHLSLVT